jgi:undecaprenyl-diphosphatase
MSPFIIALILGLVEGATEFLPVSSTGHLIAVSALLDFTGARADTFAVVIQLGAILAVIWHYRSLLQSLLMRWFKPGPDQQLGINLVVAFLPAAVIGLVFHGWIKAVLFSPMVVAIALIVGGLIMLGIEWLVPVTTAPTIVDVKPRQALWIGLAQVVSMVPGTSRAAATILGGYAAGLSRPAATEFSFLLAIPTIVGAAGLDLFRSRELLVAADLGFFLTGTVVAFMAALLVIRGFVRFVERHSFTAFAWYRMIAGSALLALVLFRVI